MTLLPALTWIYSLLLHSVFCASDTNTPLPITARYPGGTVFADLPALTYCRLLFPPSEWSITLMNWVNKYEVVPFRVSHVKRIGPNTVRFNCFNRQVHATDFSYHWQVASDSYYLGCMQEGWSVVIIIDSDARCRFSWLRCWFDRLYRGERTQLWTFGHQVVLCVKEIKMVLVPKLSSRCLKISRQAIEDSDPTIPRFPTLVAWATEVDSTYEIYDTSWTIKLPGKQVDVLDSHLPLKAYLQNGVVIDTSVLPEGITLVCMHSNVEGITLVCMHSNVERSTTFRIGHTAEGTDWRYIYADDDAPWSFYRMDPVPQSGPKPKALQAREKRRHGTGSARPGDQDEEIDWPALPIDT